MKIEVVQLDWTEPAPKRLHEILSNEAGKRAIEVALTGGHEIVFLSTVRAPASDMLRAAARIAKENGLPFKGSVVPVCECGAYGTARTECVCTHADLSKYARKILPMLKRASIVIEVLETSAREQARGTLSNEPESTMVARILAARKTQPIADCLRSDSNELLCMAIRELGAERDKVVAVAMTISRLGGYVTIQPCAIAEAIQYQHRHLANWTDDFEEIVVEQNKADMTITEVKQRDFDLARRTGSLI